MPTLLAGATQRGTSRFNAYDPRLSGSFGEQLHFVACDQNMPLIRCKILKNATDCTSENPAIGNAYYGFQAVNSQDQPAERRWNVYVQVNLPKRILLLAIDQISFDRSMAGVLSLAAHALRRNGVDIVLIRSVIAGEIRISGLGLMILAKLDPNFI
jgi:hypothetical protein